MGFITPAAIRAAIQKLDLKQARQEASLIQTQAEIAHWDDQLQLALASEKK